MGSVKPAGYLQELARLYNVQTAYYDVERRRRQASTESLLAALNALGVPASSLEKIPALLRERRHTLSQRLMEPVTVIWGGDRPAVSLRLPAGMADAGLTCHLQTEDGRQRGWRCDGCDLPFPEKGAVAGTDAAVRRLALPEGLAEGYHRLTVETAGKTAETLIIAAPMRAYLPPENHGNTGAWGVFAPLYALRARGTMGSGDYAALRSLAGLVGEMGGRAVATLPLLPAFLDEPCEPSPYAPVSRLLWNELYIDIESVPEMAASPEARTLLPSLRAEIEALRAMPLVDYRRAASLKRRLLEACCRYLFDEKAARLQEFQAFIGDNPLVADYARFRAVMEKQRSPWPSWPQPLRDGAPGRGDYDDAAANYHMYAQWLARRQVSDLASAAGSSGVKLYFDLPLGTHPKGYDTWRERASFALDATAGAPPDTVFTWGQNWWFPPPHPERIREQGYRHLIACIRHHLRYAGMLRIDHVMGLHRLFWIPRGMDASRGVYVRYRAEELYAILALESQRHRSIIVGEDLGTVPPYVRPAMARHGLQRMYVLHYELATDSGALHRPSHDAVASLNTHDMPPFAGFWRGLDIPERLKLGLVGKRDAQAEEKARRGVKDMLVSFLTGKGWLEGGGTDVRAVLKACLAFLSASRARFVMVNLEDLWLETESQNVPSTEGRNPNWRRRARYPVEELGRLPEVRDTIADIDRLRNKRPR